MLIVKVERDASLQSNPVCINRYGLPFDIEYLIIQDNVLYGQR